MSTIRLFSTDHILISKWLRERYSQFVAGGRELDTVSSGIP